MSHLTKKFNQGRLTSNTISRQFNEEYVSRAIVEMEPRKKFFTNMSSSENLPLNHGDTLTKQVRLPMLHPENMIDGNVDAKQAKLLEYSWYALDKDGVIDSEYHADDYLGANGNDKAAAIAAAKAAAIAKVGTLAAGAVVKSGAGNILWGSASYAVQEGPLVEIPEEGGVMNLLNGSTKLVSAKISFHGIGHKYTQRSIDLDSRKGEIAIAIRDLARATGEIREMQVMSSVISQSESNRMIASNVALTPAQMKATDVLTYDALTALEQELLRNNVPMDTEIQTGTDLVDTKVVSDAFVIFCNREMLPTLRKLKGPGDTIVWRPKESYAAGLPGGAKGLMDGEIGQIGSFRFVMVPDLMAYRGGGSKVSDDTTLTAGERANRHASGGYYDVFPLIVVGADSFVTTALAKKDVIGRHIMPKSDIHNDMFGEQGGVMSKWTYGFLCYRPERIRQISVVASKV